MVRQCVQLLGTFLFLVGTGHLFAQTTKYVGFSSGVMTAVARDESVGPYVFEDANAFIQLTAARKKKNFIDQLQFDLGSFELTSLIANTPKIRSRYYLLQFDRHWAFLSRDRFLLLGGACLRGRGFLREVSNGTTGEALGSLDVSGQAHVEVGKATRLEMRVQIPVVNIIAHPVYGQSGRETRVTGWENVRALELRLQYVFAVTPRAEIALGYGLSYYGYQFQESVRVATQQFGGGFRIKFEKP